MKCLISDFDGTLYDGNFINNLKSIKEFIDDGNMFVIATGRTFKNIKNKIVEAGISYNYLICSDGASIFDSNDNIIYNKYLDNDLKEKLTLRFQNDKRVSLINYDNNFELNGDVTQDTSRILIKTYKKTDYIQIIDELKKEYPYLKIYKSPNWINISIETKDVAITYLEKIIQIDKIYVVGDSYNDIEMISKYDGYIMANNTLDNDYNYKRVDTIEKLIDIIKTS